MRKRYVICAMVISLLFFSCEDQNQLPQIPLNEIQSQLDNLFCHTILNCPSIQYSTMFSSLSQCLAYIEGNEDNNLAAMIAAVKKGTISYDPVAAQNCYNDYQNFGCKMFDVPAPLSCAFAFSGLGADSTPCTLNSECINAWCDTSAGCPGICASAAIPRGSCKNNEVCETGSSCNGSACVAFSGLLPLGASCDPALHWCAATLFCEDGTCQPQLPVGGTCSDSSQCESDMWCGYLSKKCVPVTVTSITGDTCNVETGKLCNMITGLQCAFNTQTGSGTCVSAPVAGDTCYDTATLVYTSCASSFFCDMPDGQAGTCVQKKSLGTACAKDDECITGRCFNSRCSQKDGMTGC